jgi:hypothetical protein
VLLAHPSRFSLSNHLHLPSRAASTTDVLLIRSFFGASFLSSRHNNPSIAAYLESSHHSINFTLEASYKHVGTYPDMVASSTEVESGVGKGMAEETEVPGQ